MFILLICVFLFQLVSATPLSIKANHTSLDGLQAESITFKFSPTILTGGCRVTVSTVFYCKSKVIPLVGVYSLPTKKLCCLWKRASHNSGQ